MAIESRILFCSTEVDTEYIGAGTWFFHEGQWAVCAEASHLEEDWKLYLHFAISGKTLPENPIHCKTMEECKRVVSEYYESPVVDVQPQDFPAPESL
jgi:hypothetical protein